MRFKNNIIKGFTILEDADWALMDFNKTRIIRHNNSTSPDRGNPNFKGKFTPIQIRTNLKVKVLDDGNERPSWRIVYMDRDGFYVNSSQLNYHDGFYKRVYIDVPKKFRKSFKKALKNLPTIVQNRTVVF